MMDKTQNNSPWYDFLLL